MEIQPKIDQKSTNNQPQILQKATKNPPKIDLGGVLGPLEASWAVLTASWGAPGASRPRPGASWGHLGGQHGPNLAPKLEPKSNKNRSQKRSKFWCLSGSGFGRIFVGFWSKMEACWPQKWNQNRCYPQEAIFWKSLFFLRKKMISKDLGVEVGNKKRSKIDQKSFSTWEGILALIFHRFSPILEAKKEPSWEGKWIKNRSQKALKIRCEKVPLWRAAGGGQEGPTG